MNEIDKLKKEQQCYIDLYNKTINKKKKKDYYKKIMEYEIKIKNG